MIPNNSHIQGAFFKAIGYLDDSKKIAVSVSGGSDSDVVVDFIHQCGFTHKVDFVFFDTGIEYQATYDHLDYLEDKYGIYIKREKAYQSIPSCVKEYGVPFISKHASFGISVAQRNGFQFEDEPFEKLIKDYPDIPGVVKWWCNQYSDERFNIGRRKYLKEFLIENPPTFPISQKCCTYSKKKTAERYNKENDIDISIMGIRAAEGGIRKVMYKSCFSSGDISTYRPIFWFTDEDKAEYCKFYNVRHSDCYSKYGLTRTGCAGCPFGRYCDDERKVLRLYEPKLSKAVESIFKKSYDFTEKYLEFRKNKENIVKRGKNRSLDEWFSE